MPTTRLESQGQIDAIVEELKNSPGVCVISTTALETIIRDNVNLHNATHELNQRVAESLEKLNSFFESTAAEQHSARKELNDRLDLLIEKISTNNNFHINQEETDIETILKKRKETIEKIVRNEEISKYYNNLLGEPEPFVRREFRTRVNKTTADRELVHRRQQSIERVRTEIKVMEDRVTEYTEKKNSIDQTIEEYLASNPDKRTNIEQQMGNQLRSVKDNHERNTMAKLKKTDDDEKMNSFEYLITVAESNDSLNYRGQSSRARMRRGKPRRAYQQEY